MISLTPEILETQWLLLTELINSLVPLKETSVNNQFIILLLGKSSKKTQNGDISTLDSTKEDTKKFTPPLFYTEAMNILIWELKVMKWVDLLEPPKLEEPPKDLNLNNLAIPTNKLLEMLDFMERKDSWKRIGPLLTLRKEIIWMLTLPEPKLSLIGSLMTIKPDKLTFLGEPGKILSLKDISVKEEWQEN